MNAPLPRHSVSVAGIVLDAGGQVLVIKRADNGHWEPPGGVLELGETLEEGVRREILEETGVNVEVGGLTGVYKNLSKGVVALVYRCTPLTGTPRPTIEAREVRWMAPEDATAATGPRSVIELADEVGMEQAAVSQQQQLLRNLSPATAVGATSSTAFYDSHVAQLLDEAVYHSEHLRLGLSDHQTGTPG